MNGRNLHKFYLKNGLKICRVELDLKFVQRLCDGFKEPKGKFT